MFHKVKAVTALLDYRLSVQFAEGVTKIYDVKPLFNKWTAFKVLQAHPELFTSVEVDVGGYGIIWNDDLDLSCFLYKQPCCLSDSQIQVRYWLHK